MAQIYANENFPLQVVESLRRLGQDVLTTREAGQDNQRIQDADVLAFAIAQGRAVLTINRRDFEQLHLQQPNHRGIIVCTEDANTERQAQRIHDAITDFDVLTGMLVRVNRPA